MIEGLDGQGCVYGDERRYSKFIVTDHGIVTVHVNDPNQLQRGDQEMDRTKIADGPAFIQYAGKVQDPIVLASPDAQQVLRDHYRVPVGYEWIFKTCGTAAGWQRPTPGAKEAAPLVDASKAIDDLIAVVRRTTEAILRAKGLAP